MSEKNVLRTALFNPEPGKIGAVTLSRRSANSSAQLRRNNAHLDPIDVFYHEA
jgi:hypothetical protein